MPNPRRHTSKEADLPNGRDAENETILDDSVAIETTVEIATDQAAERSEEEKALGELSATVEQEMGVISKEESALEKAISSPELTDNERVEFRKEQSEIEEELSDAKGTLLSRLSSLGSDALKVVQDVGKNIKDLRDTISEAVAYKQEKKHSWRAFDFILTSCNLEHAADLSEELKKRKDNSSHSYIEKLKIPLNQQGLDIMQVALKQYRDSPEKLYQLEMVAALASKISELVSKGISLDTIRHLDFGSSNQSREAERFLEDTELFRKLQLLDQTDFKNGETPMESYELKKISESQIGLLAGESSGVSLTWNGSEFFSPGRLPEDLSSDAIRRFANFVSVAKESDSKKGDGRGATGPANYPISTFITYMDQIDKLPEGVKKICEAQYRDGKPLRDIGYTNKNLLRGLGDEEASRLESLIDSGVASLNTSNLKEYLSLSLAIYDRCSHAGIDMKETSVALLKEVDSMTDDEFGLFEEVRFIFNGYLGDIVDHFKNIRDSIGIEDGHIFMEWSHKGDQLQNFKYHTSEPYRLQIFQGMLDAAKAEKDINLFDFVSAAYGKETLGTKSFESSGSDNSTTRIARLLKESPEAVIPNILSKKEGLEHTFINFESVQQMLQQKGVEFGEEDRDALLLGLLEQKPTVFLEQNSFNMNDEERSQALEKLIVQAPKESITNFAFFDKEYLAGAPDRQACLDRIFENTLAADPLFLLKSNEFPCTPEQAQYLEVFKRIQESASGELKNLAQEIAPLIAQYKTTEEAYAALEKVEQVFLTNNIPLVGKQYKVFEILNPNQKLEHLVSWGKVDSLKELKNSQERRLLIFKDLVRSHIASADSNLEQYLTVFKDAKPLLEKFDSAGQGADPLTDEEKSRLKFFMKKINVLSGHTGRSSIEIGSEFSDDDLAAQIEALREAFGAHKNESLVEKFERTFLQRIGIDSVEEALQTMDQYKREADKRNEAYSIAGKIDLEPGDLVKQFSSHYLQGYLDQGIYSPEFIGAQSYEAKRHAKSGDATPLDTDVLMVREGQDFKDLFSEYYGDVTLVAKQKDQFKKDGLDVFQIAVIAENHYGVRTGFGSTQIDALCVRKQSFTEAGMDQLKFFVAQKGFYIPICDEGGKVMYTKEEFIQYRKIFSGVSRFHGAGMEISDNWKNSDVASQIEEAAQTRENIETVERVRNVLLEKLRTTLGKSGVRLHQGKYDDSLVGAAVTDTGSTGRGSSLDEKLDFDFVVKLDDTDWNKVSELMGEVGKVFPKADQYENRGMMMFRSSEIEIDGHKMTVDIGFNKKSDSEALDAQDALVEKYNSVRRNKGEAAYLDVLSNVRFAKKRLKEAGCYKKGLGDQGQEGGLGGIGVECWILQHGGDAVEAFRIFKEQAFSVEVRAGGENEPNPESDKTNHNGQDMPIPFEEFKKKYKIFSAGQNIRGAVKVENFTSNMTEAGYLKMAELAKSIATE